MKPCTTTRPWSGMGWTKPEKQRASMRPVEQDRARVRHDISTPPGAAQGGK